MNLIDGKISRHQATYIPVSNSLLKSSFSRTKTAAAARPVSLSNRLIYERTAAPDDKNTTINATSLRQKRDIIESTSVTPADDEVKITEATTSTSQIVDESIESIERNETFNQNDDVTMKNPSELPSDGSYPSFHVTYWMFYPYSQVDEEKKRRIMHISIVNFNDFLIIFRANRYAH